MRFWLSVVTCASLLVPLLAPLPTQAQSGDGPRIKGLRIETDAYHAFRLLAHKAKASIAVSADLKKEVFVYLDNVSLETAVNIVAGQAGAIVRRIGNSYIVATPETMQKTLEPLGLEERVNIQYVDAQTVKTQLKDAAPYVTVRVAGHSVTLIGAPEDITKAKAAIREIDVAPSQTEPPITKTVTLQSATPADIVGAVTGIPNLSAKSVGSTIVLTGSPGAVQFAQDLIASLDKPKPPMQANSRYVVYQVKYASARALQNTLRQTFSGLTIVPGPEPFKLLRKPLSILTANSLTSGGSGGTGGSSGGSSSSSTDQTISDPNDPKLVGTRTLIVGGPDEILQAALKLLTEIDTPTPQVSLDVKVISTNPATSQSLGIQWSRAIGTTVNERAGADGTTPQFGLGSFGRLPISFTATLNAFFSRTDVRILAKPTVTALDNEEGTIFVGETRRIKVSAVPGQTAANIQINTFVEIPIGIILQMTPRVQEDDMISLRVHPIVSEVDLASVQADGTFNSLTREVETTVRIKNGETLVIGGLIQERDSKTLTKVPILGDIPILGQFFRSHSRDHSRNEVMIFVTPHIVKD